VNIDRIAAALLKWAHDERTAMKEILKEILKEIHRGSAKQTLKNAFFDVVMPLIPKNELSHWVGRAVHHQLPAPLDRKSVEIFARYYSINMHEAEFPIEHYRTIGELFTRKLKVGSRPIASGPVIHPADSQISQAGWINEQTLVQAKGKNYQVAELIRSSHFSSVFEGGSYLTYYLCPTDYHRVHAPVDGRIVWGCHVPGELWPVNAWSVNNVSDLFSRNERVVTIIETPLGKVALVMVAATNVGNITMNFDSQINTKARSGERHVRERVYEPGIEIKKGDELGVFHMGSTVVMLYQKGMLEFDLENYHWRHVKMGQELV
jgi:phosphatidylserine decarboxylase